jgi:hypothetical protein
MHAGAGLSLASTTARAAQQGIASVSAPALHMRLVSSDRWLNRINAGLIAASGGPRASLLPTKRRVRAIDSTTVSEPGSTGTDWRVHYGLTLPSLRSDYFEVTDEKVGESLARVPVEKGDILLADRGYCHREAVATVVERGADVIVRLALGNFPLENPDGSPFSEVEALRKLRNKRAREWDVRFEANGKKYDARFCAIRKSRAMAERDRERARKQKSKKQKAIKPETIEATGYVFVLTTVAAAELSVERILEIYRARWQIELKFKRLKSLIGMGHVPKYDERSARAWIQAKLLTALLIERLLQRARFSPWGFELQPAQHVA